MITLNRKSWHYWLASYGDIFYEEPTSVCQYLRQVSIGLLRTLAVVALVAALVVILADTAIYWYQVIHAWQHHLKAPAEDDLALTATFIILFLVALFSYAFWRDYRDTKRRYRRNEKVVESNSFVAVAWRTIRDKTCIRVQFK